MAKKNRRQQNQNKQPSQQVQNKQVVSQQQKIVTTEVVVASGSNEEFEKNKEKFLAQFYADIDSLNKDKQKAEEEVAKTKANLDLLNEEFAQLKIEKKSVDKELKANQQKIIEADTIIATAKEKAEKLIEQAEKDKLETLTKATEEARSAWKIQSDKLQNELDDISAREVDLAKEKRKLEKEKIQTEIIKEELQIQSEHVASLKERYLNVNPEKIEMLETDLVAKESIYQTLLEKHNEQTKRFSELQVVLDAIKVEIGAEDDAGKSITVNALLSQLKELRQKYDALLVFHEDYPDEDSIRPIVAKAEKFDELQIKFEELQRKCDTIQEQLKYNARTQKELEIIKQEVDATNALNEHLLKELESHKQALESRTGDVCPELSKIDKEVIGADCIKEIKEKFNYEKLTTLKDVVEHVRNYAGCQPKGKQLFYTADDIRAFLAGLSVSRLMILQGMSGTGKSSLPRIFAEATSGYDKLIEVESSWRDRNELLGYYNDFNKKFNAKKFTIELYRSGKDKLINVPTFIVLDEMNLARIEYYFSDFLSVLQKPDKEEWTVDLVASDMRSLPMTLSVEIKEKIERENSDIYHIWEKIEKSRKGDLAIECTDNEKAQLKEYLENMGELLGAKGLIKGRKIKINDNVWFVGTANKDESTFEITDKVYDRAQVVTLNKKGEDEKDYQFVNKKFISANSLNNLFENAQIKFSTQDKKQVEDVLKNVDEFIMENFDVSFGNRIVMQTLDFVAVFVAAGGDWKTALDYQISAKIIRKIITSDKENELIDLQNILFDYPRSVEIIGKRIKELK